MSLPSGICAERRALRVDCSGSRGAGYFVAATARKRRIAHATTSAIAIPNQPPSNDLMVACPVLVSREHRLLPELSDARGLAEVALERDE
jgi:hypothetical protein